MSLLVKKEDEMRAIFIAVCAVLLLGDSSRLYSESVVSENTYVLHVEQVECDISHLQPKNIVTDKTQAVVCDVAHDEMVVFQDSKATKFPDLELAPRQQREMDQQKPVKYPSAFDADGKPIEFSTRDVGMKISATISAVTNAGVATGTTNDFVFLSYRAENVIVPLSTNEVEKMSAANHKLKDDKSPWFQSKNMNGDIGLSLGQWYVLGGHPIGENRYLTWYLKVEKK